MACLPRRIALPSSYVLLLLMPLWPGRSWTSVGRHRSRVKGAGTRPRHQPCSAVPDPSAQQYDVNDHPFPPPTLDYSVNRVKTRQQILDVLVFRHNLTTLEEHLDVNPQMDHLAALQWLTRFYDDHGRDLALCATNNNNNNSSSSTNNDMGELVQFYAVLEGTNDNADHGAQALRLSSSDVDRKDLHRTHGVIGSVDAKRLPFPPAGGVERGMEHVLEDLVQLEDAILIELKNLRVHQVARRQGIGRALVDTVQAYAQSQLHQQLEYQDQHLSQQTQEPRPKRVTVFLQVDRDNDGAQQLYSQAGFVMTRKDEDRMDWSIAAPDIAQKLYERQIRK